MHQQQKNTFLSKIKIKDILSGIVLVIIISAILMFVNEWGIIEYLLEIKDIALGFIFIFGLLIMGDVITGKDDSHNKICTKIALILSPVFLIISLILNEAYKSGVVTIIFAVIRAYIGIAFVVGAYLFWKVIREHIRERKKHVED